MAKPWNGETADQCSAQINDDIFHSVTRPGSTSRLISSHFQLCFHSLSTLRHHLELLTSFPINIDSKKSCGNRWILSWSFEYRPEVMDTRVRHYSTTSQVSDSAASCDGDNDRCARAEERLAAEKWKSQSIWRLSWSDSRAGRSELPSCSSNTATWKERTALGLSGMHYCMAHPLFILMSFLFSTSAVARWRRLLRLSNARVARAAMMMWWWWWWWGYD